MNSHMFDTNGWYIAGNSSTVLVCGTVIPGQVVTTGQPVLLTFTEEKAYDAALAQAVADLTPEAREKFLEQQARQIEEQVASLPEEDID